MAVNMLCAASVSVLINGVSRRTHNKRTCMVHWLTLVCVCITNSVFKTHQPICNMFESSRTRIQNTGIISPKKKFLSLLFWSLALHTFCSCFVCCLGGKFDACECIYHSIHCIYLTPAHTL